MRLSPREFKSGSSVRGRTQLSKASNARLRKALYMTTLSAVQRNPWLRGHYERLRRNGKLPKVALVAVMRKLLAAVYSVAKNRRPFVYSSSADGEPVAQMAAGPGEEAPAAATADPINRP